jgi:hypothetical protein
MIKALEPLLSAGRIKLYSPDSVAGQVWFDRGQHPGHRMWMQHQYHEWIRHEVVPAIYTDCKTTDIPIWTAGASIGAFHAAAAVCRSPDVFHRALSMSGTYNLMRFIEVDTPTEAFRWVSPLYVVPKLQGAHLDQLRHPLRADCDGPGALGGRERELAPRQHPGRQGCAQPRRPLGPRVAPRLGDLARNAPAVPRPLDEIDSPNDCAHSPTPTRR